MTIFINIFLFNFSKILTKIPLLAPPWSRFLQPNTFSLFLSSFTHPLSLLPSIFMHRSKIGALAKSLPNIRNLPKFHHKTLTKSLNLPKFHPNSSKFKFSRIHLTSIKPNGPFTTHHPPLPSPSNLSCLPRYPSL